MIFLQDSQDAIRLIESLYPPDSQYQDTAEIGRNLMDCTVGNGTGYMNWRQLEEPQLIELAKAMLEEHGVMDYITEEAERPEPGPLCIDYYSA